MSRASDYKKWHCKIASCFNAGKDPTRKILPVLNALFLGTERVYTGILVSKHPCTSSKALWAALVQQRMAKSNGC